MGDDPPVLAGEAGPDRPGVRQLAAVALGGALGAPARYEMTRLIHVAKDTFPWATFWTNVSGSVALGFVLIYVIRRFPSRTYLRPFIAVGFLGAYTTMSTYAVDTALLVKDSRPGVAVAYALSSMVAGFLAAWLGILGGRAVLGKTAR